jgi:hypothetical protein
MDGEVVRRAGSRGLHAAILEIPMIVQRLLFPVLVAIGEALGKYGKYAEAPEPIRG